MRVRLLSLVIACSSAAQAADVAVTVRVGDGPVDAIRTEGVVWHALQLRHGLEPSIATLESPWDLAPGEDDAALDGQSPAAVEMRAQGLTTHLLVDVTWRNQVVGVGDGLVAVPPAAEVQITERTLGPDGLSVRSAWHTVGAPAVYRALHSEPVPDWVPSSRAVGRSGEGEGVLTLPDVSLEEAVWVALDSLVVPAWGGRPAPLRIPVAVAGDAAYRAFYGNQWRREAVSRIRSASSILAQMGLELVPVGFEAWEAPADAKLSVMLADLAANPTEVDGAVLRVAFTQRPERVDQEAGIEDVGRAFTPGVDVVVADQSLPPGHVQAWDVADEGVIVAHEVLHALGAPHEASDGYVMSAQKVGLVWRVTDRTSALARASAEARVVHWDATSALLGLANAAERWLAGAPQAQLAYVVQNLPAVPAPGSLKPEQASALVNAALGHAYLRLADAEPQEADRHRSLALAHVQAAIAMAPQLSDDLEPWLEEAGISAVGLEVLQEQAAIGALPPSPAPLVANP